MKHKTVAHNNISHKYCFDDSVPEKQRKKRRKEIESNLRLKGSSCLAAVLHGFRLAPTIERQEADRPVVRLDDRGQIECFVRGRVKAF